MTGMSNVTKLAGEPSGQEFLVFTLGDEEYGIDILKVQEIRGYDQVTRIANTPAFIKGVTNLRGVIVPIVDLRVKFSQGDVDYNDNTVVIVLNLGQRVVGIVVDGVSDVLSLTSDQIRPAPEFAVTLSTEYLTGLGALGERMLILVNIEKLLNSDEMALLDIAASQVNAKRQRPVLPLHFTLPALLSFSAPPPSFCDSTAALHSATAAAR
jgi:purine-binding chemotaxis protein CheW